MPPCMHCLKAPELTEYNNKGRIDSVYEIALIDISNEFRKIVSPLSSFYIHLNCT